MSLLAGLSILVLVTRCGGDDDAPDKSSEGGGQRSQITTQTGPTGESEAADEAGPSLGTSSGSFVDSTLTLTSLERTSANVVTAKFAISVPVDADETFQVSDRLASKEDGFKRGQDRVSGATLTDEVNGKRYFVLTDSEGECLCTTNIAGDGFIDKGETADLFAKFPAPPGAVKKVSFSVPTFQSIDDVPISG